MTAIYLLYRQISENLQTEWTNSIAKKINFSMKGSCFDFIN